MPDMLELVENLRAEKASPENLFGGVGTGVRARREAKERDPRYRANLIETINFMRDIEIGRRRVHEFEEAMTTSDFPILFADVLDRQLLGYFNETTPTWQSYCRKGKVRDFRKAKKFAVDGAETVLPDVKEREEYPEAPLSDRADELLVSKFGRRVDLSWEALINDDLDAFSRIPERLARAARRSEQKKAVELWIDSKGPHASLYTAEFKNIITGNPELSIESLQDALLALSKMVDFEGEPIVVDMVSLVIPPALEVVANNIINATEVWLTGHGGTEDQKLRAANWMKNRLQIVVEPYIPFVATKENGDTTWALFAEPSVGRPAIEMDYLLGYEEPSLYERLPNARRIGGGGGEVLESFEDDSRAWRIRHVLGGTRLINTGGAKATVASSGKGS
jgi:hypothetical protein